MWIRTQDGRLINLDRIVDIAWFIPTDFPNSVSMYARMDEGKDFPLMLFTDEDGDAETNQRDADDFLSIILLCIEAGRKTLDLTSDVVLKNIKSGVMP